MKNCLIFFGLFIGSGLVFATSQTALNQDKPARLYVKSYIESAGGNINILEDGSGYLGYTERQAKRIDTFSENIKYQDGLTGSANYQGNENYNDSDDSANGGSQLQMFGNKTISVSSGAGINYSAVSTMQITSGSDSLTGSGWDIYGNSSESIGNDTYSSTNNGYGMLGVHSEHCDVGTPIRDHSGIPSFRSFAAEAPPNWQENYKRNAQMIMKLQTGGKATSKLRNLFALSASGTQINPVHVNEHGEGPYFSSFDYTFYYNGNPIGYFANIYTYYAPFDNPFYSVVGSAQPTETSISAQNIAIGSCGNLNSNGVLYRILPDNADVDVTPYVANVDYYTFNVSATKYHSYFDLYVDQPNPGYSFIPIYNGDTGHVFWELKTDAPSDALQYISTNLTTFLGTNGFFPGPSGSICSDAPGQLQNNNGSANIKRTFYIGFNNLIDGLIYVKGIHDSPPAYCWSGINCVAIAVFTGHQAGVHILPDDQSPQNFGVDLVEMYSGSFWDADPFYAP